MRWTHPIMLPVAVIVAVVFALDSTGALPPGAAQLVDDLAQLAGATFACASCGFAARRVSGVERTWRVLMAVGIGGWAAGQAIWTWYLVARDQELPSPSLADAGYFVLPIFAFGALLVIAAKGSAVGRRDQATQSFVPAWVHLVVDGLIVTGSVIILAWLTSLEALFRLGATSTFAFALAVAYPVTDLLLAVMVVLMLSTQPVALRFRPQLVLLALGLIAITVSDTVFANLAASGAESMPPRYDAGFVVGPVLIGLAALTLGASTGPAPASSRPRSDIPWANLLLPYVPLTISGGLILAQEVSGQEEHFAELYLGTPVITLVLVRQLIALIDNAFLIRRVSDAQELLSFQASHDPLTGLANRTLFQTRLGEAVDRNRDGTIMAVFLLDLDDFKEINDRYGHAVGDQVLQAVARRLRSSVRGGDLVARLGGDEFAVLTEVGALPPREIGLRILAAMRQPFAAGGELVSVGASMGGVVASGTEPRLTADQLQQRADTAMYAGKRRGKGLLMFHGSDVVE